MAVLSHTNSFELPLRERPAVVQRSEIIRSRKYNLGKHISDQDDASNFNALCRGERLLVCCTAIRDNLIIENHLIIVILVVLVGLHQLMNSFLFFEE